jgi:hypothetical protein
MVAGRLLSTARQQFFLNQFSGRKPLTWRGKAHWTRCRKVGIGSVRPTEGTSAAASRHGRKSKEAPYFQWSAIIKEKFVHPIKDKFPPGNAGSALAKETRQPNLRKNLFWIEFFEQVFTLVDYSTKHSVLSNCA